MEEIQIIKDIKTVVDGLNICEIERLKASGFTNSCFINEDGSLTESHKWNIKEKKKYIYIDCGTGGVFMVIREDGEIYNIKGYGTPDKNKKIKSNLGKIQDYIDNDRDIKDLHKKRYNYLR